jgi:hypothetical protein
MGAVREFGLAMLKPLGAPAGPIATYIEVPFKTGDDRMCRPDGVVQTTRAGRTWTVLIEVKTSAGELERPQVETYLDIARDNGFEAVLTISNQLAPAHGVHPVEVDRRKLKKVALHHLSWAEVLTIAVQQRVHHGVSDPDQAWILGELIRYLEYRGSGALDFSDMGANWVGVREAMAAGTLRSNDKGLADVLSRWEQLLRFAALRLGRELGADVQVVVSRKEAAEPALRIAAQAQSLVSAGRLSGSLRIPAAVAPLDIVADLRASRVSVAVDVDAPREGRPATRVNWLVRQLKDAPEVLRIDAFAANSRTSTSALLRAVREDPEALIDDPKRELRTFRVIATSPLGTKRGAGRGGFIDSVLAALDGFYGTVVQRVRPWTARAPQLPKGGRTAAEEAGLDITPPTEDPVEALESVDEGVDGFPPEASIPEPVLEGVEAAQNPSSGLPMSDDDVAMQDNCGDRGRIGERGTRELERSRGSPRARAPSRRQPGVPARPGRPGRAGAGSGDGRCRARSLGGGGEARGVVSGRAGQPVRRRRRLGVSVVLGSSERNSTERGVKADKAADFAVTLNTARNGGAAACFVIEAKDSPSLSKRAVIAELRADMANRDAKAGILVFAHQDQTPDKLILHTMGDMAIVACEDGDSMALELAYQWARWVTCRELDSTGADWTRIQRAVEQATRALDVHKTIKGNHTAAKKSIDEAAKWIDHLVIEVRGAIEVLGQAVDDAQEAQAA